MTVPAHLRLMKRFAAADDSTPEGNAMKKQLKFIICLRNWDEPECRAAIGEAAYVWPLLPHVAASLTLDSAPALIPAH